MTSQGGGGGGATAAQIPTSFGHELRACLRCRLVKTYDQFRDSGCENCPFFQMEEDQERVVDCTTPNFTGLISVMDPTRSWAARWLRVGKFVPGCYTLAVSEALPHDLQNICEEDMCLMFHRNVFEWQLNISVVEHCIALGSVRNVGRDQVVPQVSRSTLANDVVGVLEREHQMSNSFAEEDAVAVPACIVHFRNSKI